MSDLLTRMLRQWLLQKQPQLTEAEQQVLNSGGTWWEQQLFTGKPDWQQLYDIPLTALSEKEQHFLDHQVEDFCQLLDPWQISQDNDLPQAVWESIKKQKLWGLVIPEKYQGLGFSAQAHSAIVSKIASRCTSTALTVMVPNSLGPAELLHRYGTETQKQHYLPRLACGQEIGCFALTSLVAGSDATAITDKGVVCEDDYDGKKTLGIRLNFSKRYITLAPIATLIGLAFKLYDPDHLLGEQEEIGITLALVPNHLSGVEAGLRHYPMHMSFLNGPVSGKDVFIPLDLIVGGRQQCGQGWQMMLECLALGRGISLPALASANAKVSSLTSTAYTALRQQFHRSIGEFEGVQLALARIVSKTLACEAMRVFTAEAVDAGVRPAIASAITKYHLTELSRDIINDAMDVHGGRAVQNGPRNYLMQFYDTAPVTITVEGANILTRNLIIFGQGVMRCHPFIRHEISAEDASLLGLMVKHVNFSAKNMFKCLVAGLMGPSRRRKKQQKQLTRMSTAFALVTDIALLYLGKRLKISEALSARLADILGQLYMASALLWYADKMQLQSQDRLLVDWNIQHCLYRIQQALDEFLNNFPYRLVARFIRWVIFPYGRCYHYPADSLSVKIAKFVQQPSTIREHFKMACFIGSDQQDPVAILERAWRQCVAGSDAEKSIWDALQVDQF